MNTLPTECSLPRHQRDAAAHAIAQHVFQQGFQLHMSHEEYRRWLGRIALELDYQISVEELHQLVLAKLQDSLEKTFGWQQCTISGAESVTAIASRQAAA